jgi:hypothetical protein
MANLGLELRNDGMRAVLREAWAVRAISIFRRNFASGDLVTGEVLRMQLRSSGLDEPRHRNAWGALTNSLANRGLIEDTGRSKNATDPNSHARRLPIWRVR